MYVLVDYDNIEALERRRGLTYLALKILSAIDASNLPSDTRAEFRLYGGWYQGTSLSRRAQELGAEIRREFPTVQTVGVGRSLLRFRVSAELATAMIKQLTTAGPQGR